MQQHKVLLTVELVYDLDEVRFKEKVNAKEEVYHVFDFDALRKATIESVQGLEELTKRGVELRFGSGLNESKLVHAQVERPIAKPVAKAESDIDKAFAEMGGDDFTLDDGPSSEEKFKAVCQERGYSDDLAKKVRAIIAQHGASDAVKDRLNTLLKARKQKVMRGDDWKVAQELVK